MIYGNYNKASQILEFLITFLHLHQHLRFHIRHPNGNGLHLIASSRNIFSAIASRQKAEIFKQRLLCKKAVPDGVAWRFISRESLTSGATSSAGRAKKDWGRCWESVEAMGLTWADCISMSMKTKTNTYLHIFMLPTSLQLRNWTFSPVQGPPPSVPISSFAG